MSAYARWLDPRIRAAFGRWAPISLELRANRELRSKCRENLIFAYWARHEISLLLLHRDLLLNSSTRARSIEHQRIGGSFVATWLTQSFPDVMWLVINHVINHLFTLWQSLGTMKRSHVVSAVPHSKPLQVAIDLLEEEQRCRLRKVCGLGLLAPSTTILLLVRHVALTFP